MNLGAEQCKTFGLTLVFLETVVQFLCIFLYNFYGHFLMVSTKGGIKVKLGIGPSQKLEKIGCLWF